MVQALQVTDDGEGRCSQNYVAPGNVVLLVDLAVLG